jgi:hypothetical protein
LSKKHKNKNNNNANATNNTKPPQKLIVLESYMSNSNSSEGSDNRSGGGGGGGTFRVGSGAAQSLELLAGRSRANVGFMCHDCQKIALVFRAEQGNKTELIPNFFRHAERAIVEQAGWTDFVGGYWLCSDCKPVYAPTGTAQDRQNQPALRAQVTAIEARRKHVLTIAKANGCSEAEAKTVLDILNALDRLDILAATNIATNGTITNENVGNTATSETGPAAAVITIAFTEKYN